MNNKLKLRLMGIVFFSVYFLDRITKILAFRYLSDKNLTFLWDTIRLTYTENQGAFLGMGSGLSDVLRPLMLIVIPSVFMLLFIYYCIYHEQDKISVILITSILAGGIANIQDRVFNSGKVIDFLNFGIGSLRTGILNIADVAITFGGIFFIIREIKKHRVKNAGGKNV